MEYDCKINDETYLTVARLEKHVNAFESDYVCIGLGESEVSSLAENVSSHLRVHSQSIWVTPGNLSDRCLSRSEGIKGKNKTKQNNNQKTEKMSVKGQRPNENGTYSLGP